MTPPTPPSPASVAQEIVERWFRHHLGHAVEQRDTLEMFITTALTTARAEERERLQPYLRHIGTPTHACRIGKCFCGLAELLRTPPRRRGGDERV